MKRNLKIVVIILFLLSTGCSTSYKAKPLPLQTPAAYPNNVEIEGCQIGAKAFDDATEAKEAFGFNILGAGLLPVQVVLDNQGPHPIEIVGQQTFLEDNKVEVITGVNLPMLIKLCQCRNKNQTLHEVADELVDYSRKSINQATAILKK